MPSLRDRARDFLVHEANLLDERRFDDWLALYDEDAYYWLPIKPDQTTRRLTLAHFDENKTEMEFRVRRLDEPTAYTEQPRFRSIRVVSNVALEESKSDGQVTVRSKLVLHDYRVRQFADDDSHVYCGTVRHGLRDKGETFSIAWKRVDLINSEAAFSIMSSPL